jgi:hypothetical protein
VGSDSGRVSKFRRVDLPGPRRRCLTCAELADDQRFAEHHEWHHSTRSRTSPATGQVVDQVPGTTLEVGTRLGLLASFHSVYWEWNGSEAISWLFEVLDGPMAGDIYYVLTFAEYPEPGSGLPPMVDAAQHPLWAPGLEPAR